LRKQTITHCSSSKQETIYLSSEVQISFSMNTGHWNQNPGGIIAAAHQFVKIA
jgi:hypothetical protein